MRERWAVKNRQKVGSWSNLVSIRQLPDEIQKTSSERKLVFVTDSNPKSSSRNEAKNDSIEESSPYPLKEVNSVSGKERDQPRHAKKARSLGIQGKSHGPKIEGRH